MHDRLPRADIIKIWKIFNSEIDIGLEILFERHSTSSNYRRFFNGRCVAVWNNLPAEVVNFDCVGKFKKGFDARLQGRFFSMWDSR